MNESVQIINKNRQNDFKLRESCTDLDVAAFQSEIEASALVLDEVESNLRVSLALQVSNNRLPDELGVAHHVENLDNE